MTVLVWLAVPLIGGSGSVLRFLVDRFVARRSNRALPLGTLTVNVTGSLALNLFGRLALGPNTALLVGTAAIGSYTTFSTWVFETQRLGEERQLTVAVFNLFVSVMLGVAAAALGQTIGGQL
ncbi:MAG: fluoride efflux transporter CrcB [Nocardioidaceae bacterium]